MGFVQFCVGLVITVIIGIITFIWGGLMEKNMLGRAGDFVEGGMSWGFFVSTLGFGVCLTILLYQNGVIK